MADLWISRPGAELACWVRGDGPPVGYAHGMLLSRGAEDTRGLHDWSPVITERRLVRYDARAHGASTGRPVAEDYTWSHLADDLIAVAETVGEGAPIDFMGASMGCGTLLWAASRAPERFRRLVLIIPPTTGATRVNARLYLAEAAAVERGTPAPPSAPPPIFASLPSYPQKAAVDLDLLPSVLRGAAASDLPDRDVLGRVQNDTLILAWETDPVHPVSSAHLLHEVLPHAKLQVATVEAEVRRWPEDVAEYLNS
ncbi:alpha/beta fold hydrolase [Catenuloplanes japonicus]|uniref:alpha/beta fold hydrolase n=1 Tax=Catenuloplanes japonicus TaxID=33876 RepID=UPI000524A651|nr:alpha/beta fold hydrolase [Catenuloplanes japonicus]